MLLLLLLLSLIIVVQLGMVVVISVLDNLHGKLEPFFTLLAVLAGAVAVGSFVAPFLLVTSALIVALVTTRGSLDSS